MHLDITQLSALVVQASFHVVMLAKAPRALVHRRVLEANDARRPMFVVQEVPTVERTDRIARLVQLPVLDTRCV